MTTPPDIPFANFKFKADIGSYAGTDTRVDRNTPDRLTDIVNVKDWGAKGDNKTDDRAAIHAAINYAMGLHAWPNGGAIVYIPPGIYWLGPPGGTTSTPLQIGGHLRGAGRSATILRGNFNTGASNKKPWVVPDGWNPNVGSPLGNPSYLVQHTSVSLGDSLVLLADLTIWNDSQIEGSGAFFSEGNSTNMEIRNCHFHGTIGAAFPQNAFGVNVHDCIFTSSIPKPRADAASRGDPFWHVGLYAPQGQVVNCWAEGFAVGFAIPGQGAMYGCTACRCSQGFRVGATISPFDTSADLLVSPWNCNGYNIIANRCIGCIGGMYIQRANGVVIASNVFSSGTGCYGDAPIDTMNWASNTVTVHTSAAHNITDLAKVKLTPSASGWLPTSDGIVTAHVTSANDFTYTLTPGPSPTTITGGTWNYPASIGIMPTVIGGSLSLIANVFLDIIGPDIAPPDNFGQQTDLVCMSMSTPHGWTNTIATSYSGWNFIQCWTPGAMPPFFIIPYAALPGPGVANPLKEGLEFTITNGRDAAFGAVVTAGTTGGSCKVRYTKDEGGGNWIRVG
jgi:hypothetical protein